MTYQSDRSQAAIHASLEKARKEPLPTSHDIEHVAVAMASITGIIWHKADSDTRMHYRLAASAALMRLGLDRAPAAARTLAAELEACGAKLKRAALALEFAHEGAEAIPDITQAANTIAALGKFLADDEAEAEVIG